MSKYDDEYWELVNCTESIRNNEVVHLDMVCDLKCQYSKKLLAFLKHHQQLVAELERLKASKVEQMYGHLVKSA